MSNQVYSNNTQKYFEFPGMNNYSAEAITIGVNSTNVINFSTPGSIQNVPGILTFNAGATSVTKPGMYSFMYYFVMEHGTDPGTKDIDFEAKLILNRSPEFSGLDLATFITRIPSRGSDTGSLIRKVPLCATLYMKPGDTITPSITNNVTAATETLKVLVSSQLVVNKIY